MVASFDIGGLRDCAIMLIGKMPDPRRWSI